MALRDLKEELADVLSEARGTAGSSDCGGCGSLAEVLRQLAEESGLSGDALNEAVKCEPECRSRFVESDGTFKGSIEEACQKMFKECCKGVKDPEALCGYIGRRAGRTA